jgi:transcriptional regulator with XRE-family HTH domain
MTDRAIAKELGSRLKQRRLNKNLSQKAVSASAGISITATQGAEKGETTMLTFIKIMRALKALDTLEDFLPEIVVSPIALARMEGKKRKKASGKKTDR